MASVRPRFDELKLFGSADDTVTEALECFGKWSQTFRVDEQLGP